MDEWPKPPMWREDLDKIRELMTPEEFEALMRKLVHIEPDRCMTSAWCTANLTTIRKPRAPKETI